MERERMSDIPGQNDADKHDTLVRWIAFAQHKYQAVNTESSGQPTSAQYTHNPQLPVARHLERPGQWQWEDKNDEVTDDTDHGIGDESSGLVETSPPWHITEPVHGNGIADADLDDESDGIVTAEASEQNVDEPDFAAVRSEDAGENR